MNDPQTEKIRSLPLTARGDPPSGFGNRKGTVFDMTLVILAAGMGSRYGGMKQIDPIGPGGEFIIDYSCFDAARAGFDRVVFVIKRENLEAFSSTVGARVEKYIKIEFVFQDMNDLPEGYEVPEGRKKPWGTAHALLAARNTVDDCFAVINADDFYGRETFAIMAEHLRAAEARSCRTPGGRYDCCMVGFRLGNTLTENGTVSRGICHVEDGRLTDVTERAAIRRSADGSCAEYEENGVWTPLPLDAVASMNCFGLTPSVFGYISAGFAEFLSDLPDPMKSEYYLPFALDRLAKNGIIDIAVERTPAKWYGVTYAADKEPVKASIRALIAAGEYPEPLAL